MVNLKHYWMPNTDNPRSKAAPKTIVGAKDMHYRLSDGRAVLDALASCGA